MEKLESVSSCLESSDPLSGEVFIYLLSYREEDGRVDFKKTFDESDREWLEITKDVVSFANSHGGYLVFGIEDASYSRIGLTQDLAKVLTNTNNILQKVNRFIEPQISHLRTKEYKDGGLIFVAWYIPETVGKIHVVSRKGSFSYPKGQEKTILQKGTIWVRRSAGNHLADSSDLEDIFTRRNERFRDSLMSKIARVVHAGSETEVFILEPDPTESDGKRFTIVDAPDALEVKGLSFSVAPTTDEQELAGWIALFQRDPDAVPPAHRLWAWYADRNEKNFSEDQRLQLAEFCLLSDVPAFYWIKGSDANSIKEMIRHAVPHSMSTHLSNLVGTAAFLGKKFHNSVIHLLGDRASKLPDRFRTYPAGGPNTLMGRDLIQSTMRAYSKLGHGQSHDHILEELNAIAETAKKQRREPGVQKRYDAVAFDCYLYARDDRYVKK